MLYKNKNLLIESINRMGWGVREKKDEQKKD